jgi:ribosome biogenesis GTPase
VQAAVADGRIDPERLARWQKLRREDALNTETVHERRARERDFGRVVREAVDWKGRGKG